MLGTPVGDSWAARGYRLFLGLDTSLTKTGWAVVAVRFDGGSVVVVEYGLIKSNAKRSDGERLREIHSGIIDVLSRYPVQPVIAREAGIVRFNLPTKQIFKAHGVTEFALSDFQMYDVNIQSVKAWARRVTGSAGKRNDKEMVAEAVRIYFDTPDMALNKDGDEADALAVVLFYLIKEGIAKDSAA